MCAYVEVGITIQSFLLTLHTVIKTFNKSSSVSADIATSPLQLMQVACWSTERLDFVNVI